MRVVVTLVPSFQGGRTFPEADRMTEARGHILYNHYSLNRT